MQSCVFRIWILHPCAVRLLTAWIRFAFYNNNISISCSSSVEKLSLFKLYMLSKMKYGGI